MPYNSYNPMQYQKPYDALVPVNGDESARSYPMPPSSTAILFDQNEDIFYIKKTDVSGFPTLSKFKFEPMETEPAAQNQVYVTKDDLTEAMDGLMKRFEELVNG